VQYSPKCATQVCMLPWQSPCCPWPDKSPSSTSILCHGQISNPSCVFWPCRCSPGVALTFPQNATQFHLSVSLQMLLECFWNLLKCCWNAFETFYLPASCWLNSSFRTQSYILCTLSWHPLDESKAFWVPPCVPQPNKWTVFFFFFNHFPAEWLWTSSLISLSPFFHMLQLALISYPVSPCALFSGKTSTVMFRTLKEST
jgi:hypothetical protein